MKNKPVMKLDPGQTLNCRKCKAEMDRLDHADRMITVFTCSQCGRSVHLTRKQVEAMEKGAAL
jgi:transcription elongation factor Elf1